MNKYKFSRKEIAFAMKFDKREVPHGLTQTEAYDLANLLLAKEPESDKWPNSVNVPSLPHEPVHTTDSDKESKVAMQNSSSSIT